MTAPEIPAEIIEAAAHAIFAQEQCDKRQAKDVPYQWNTRLNEADHEEYRDLGRAALAVAWPLIAAHVLNGAADALQAEECDGNYNPNACETCRAVKSLRESATAQTPEEPK